MTNVQSAVEVLKSIGIKWCKKTIGLKWESGQWCINAWVFNEDGSRKPVYGILKFDDVGDAVDCENLMRA